jgi:hypothetical protein
MFWGENFWELNTPLFEIFGMCQDMYKLFFVRTYYSENKLEVCVHTQYMGCMNAYMIVFLGAGPRTTLFATGCFFARSLRPVVVLSGF